MINTLSLLEHMGSHKIMLTQHSAAIDQATLKHVAEEAHHAFFMKRQAEKTAERALEYVADDLLAPSSARMYFQRLESATVRALGEKRSARAAYLYMSMIVEFRALWFYGLVRASAEARAARAVVEARARRGASASWATWPSGSKPATSSTTRARREVLAAERKLYSRLLGALERAAA